MVPSRHYAQPRLAFSLSYAVFTGQHSAGRHSEADPTHPSRTVAGRKETVSCR